MRKQLTKFRRTFARLGAVALTVALLAVSVLTLPVLAAGDKTYSVSYGTAVVDGVISQGEWDKAQKEAVSKVAFGDCKDKENTEGNSTVSYRAMWDESYLYLLVELTDDELVINENTGTSYRNDSFFLLIGEDVTKTGAYNDSNYMLCFFPYKNANDYNDFNEKDKTGALICRNGTHDVTKDSYVCKVQGNDSDGYTAVMELKIAMNSAKLEAEKSLAFDLQYNDANSGKYGSTSNNRETILVWSADGTDGKGPNAHLDLWGTVTMASAPAPDPDTDPDTGTDAPLTGDAALILTLSALGTLALSAWLVRRRKQI